MLIKNFTRQHRRTNDFFVILLFVKQFYCLNLPFYEMQLEVLSTALVITQSWTIDNQVVFKFPMFLVDVCKLQKCMHNIYRIMHTLNKIYIIQEIYLKFLCNSLEKFFGYVSVSGYLFTREKITKVLFIYFFFVTKICLRKNCDT